MSSPGVRYPIKDGPYSSHSVILRLMGEGRGRTLLDVGCSDGELLLRLEGRGWAGLGIEPDLRDAARARAKGLNVLGAEFHVAKEQLNDSFDAIVLADVLEHMADPLGALNLVCDVLRPEGEVIVSIPNIAHLSVRALLLFGRFPYMERGPLDRTHLRFFTRKSAVDLLESAGLCVVDIQVTPAPIEILLAGIGLRRIPLLLHKVNLAAARFWSRGLGYQFVIRAVKVGSRPECRISCAHS